MHSIIYFGGTFSLDQTYLKPINGRIDNKMAAFFQKYVLKSNLKTNKKKSLVGATGEEIS